jgi:hypothetical protein
MSSFWLVRWVLRVCVDLRSDFGLEEKTKSTDYCCALSGVSGFSTSVILLWRKEHTEGFMRYDVEITLHQISLQQFLIPLICELKLFVLFKRFVFFFCFFFCRKVMP